MSGFRTNLEAIHDAGHGTYLGPCPECKKLMEQFGNRGWLMQRSKGTAMTQEEYEDWEQGGDAEDLASQEAQIARVLIASDWLIWTPDGYQ